ncbi:hypothetical protein RB653_006352 [Dictyostelium firmibasis]|uniref:Cytochrome P450 n=1 Tax=Dictyostelium firmibasis TaxID=79012 RepID=A0AAN7Z573_9MYCE
MIFNILLFIFLFCIVHSGLKKYKKIHDKELKGPFPIPILGNLHQLGKAPHHTLTDMHKLYGDIFRVHFGDVYTVVVSDPNLIREMFIDNHETFMYRPLLPTFKFGSGGYHGLSLSNERWERTRELVQNAMKRASIKKIYNILDDQVYELIKSMKVYQKSCEPFEIHLFAQRFTLSIMFKYIFDEDVSYDEDITKGKISGLVQPMEDIFKSLGSGKLGDFITVAQPFYYQWLKLTDKPFSTVNKFIHKRYLEHLKTIDNNNPRDLMDILINEFSNDKDLIPTILQTCLDMFLAGNDTTAASIIWFTLRMQEHPEIQMKAYNEIKEAVGNRDRVLLSDRPKTPYLNAIIKEGLRLNPVGPFGLPHRSSNDIIIGGGHYFIPKDSQILINYRGLGFNEKYFENPSQYDPSRFLNKNNIDPYMPFGVGPRSCIGQSLAADEQYLAFSNILLNFNLKNIGKPVSDHEEFGLTLKPNKFKVLLESR